MLWIQKKDDSRDAARDRRHVMQAGGGIENHVTGGKLYLMHAVGVLDDQFAAVIFIGLREKQSGRKIGADSVSGSADLPDGIVHVSAE